VSGPLILSPLPVAAVVGGWLPANLLTEDPREIWTAAAGATPQLQVDLGGARTFDTIFLGHAALTQAAALAVSVDGGAQQQVGFALPRLAWRTAHGLLVLDAPVTGRNLTLTITVAAADQPFRAGVLMVGLSFRPIWPHEWGGGRLIFDCGTRTQLAGGGFGVAPGARKAGWQWTQGDLTDDEREQLHAILLDRGETRPVLAVEDYAATTGLCERIHYGTFDRIDADERRDVNLNRRALRVEDWL
jgi:hypothetical protein